MRHRASTLSRIVRGPEALRRHRLRLRQLASADMSATIEREFEELDAQNRWQQLYLVSRWFAQQEL